MYYVSCFYGAFLFCLSCTNQILHYSAYRNAFHTNLSHILSEPPPSYSKSSWLLFRTFEW
ncbi:hypothetical protein BDV36DRAFT_275328 [Aspergillus pseudocaelatus]|uniref:Uncharacterized protein n=1 Tax=Aspergillus pseudocaelatus TaxID=1825620 RepID=A0ABQ6W784_9EURO|nr:hypothetical protein BDV36DRAFT_275328 [Aspergillus pseudocaelatus]